MIPPQQQVLVQGRYKLNRLLGKGGFGEVYSGVVTSTGEEVAVKIVPNTKRYSLAHEVGVMQTIQKFDDNPNARGIPALKYFGDDGGNTILVMTLHGPSLEELRSQKGSFPLRTVVALAVEMLTRVEFLHSVGFIHRDIKPANFLMGGVGKIPTVFLIDFGLTIRYGGSHSRVHEGTAGCKFVGTSWFASLRTQQGFPQSRRDDIEQLVYTIIYLYVGRLPWSDLHHTKHSQCDESAEAIAAVKEGLTTAQICAKCPPQFEHLLRYARSLAFDETPGYDMCKGILLSAFPKTVLIKKRELTCKHVYIEKEDAAHPHCLLPTLKGAEERNGTRPAVVWKRHVNARDSTEGSVKAAPSIHRVAL